MPPKSKAKPALKKAPDAATPDTETPDKTSKKRKVDWATIDDKKPFQGFRLEALKTKSRSSPAHKKQRTERPVIGALETYKDAPLDADIVQKNPFTGSELSETHYKVKPALEWESTQRYRKFTSKSNSSQSLRLTV